MSTLEAQSTKVRLQHHTRVRPSSTERSPLANFATERARRRKGRRRVNQYELRQAGVRGAVVGHVFGAPGGSSPRNQGGHSNEKRLWRQIQVATAREEGSHMQRAARATVQRREAAGQKRQTSEDTRQEQTTKKDRARNAKMTKTKCA